MKRQSDIPEGETTPPIAERTAPRPRRIRSLLGTLLAGVLALLLIAIVLAIVSKIGQLRLAQLGRQTATIAPLSHSNRQALGLQAPLPIPEGVVRPEIPAGIDSNVPAPIVPAPQAALPPALQLPDAVPLPGQVQPARRPAPIWQTIAALPYDRIYSAFLWKPATTAPPVQPVARPAVTEDFMRLHRDSLLTPAAARVIAEQRSPQPTLAQLRAQAAMLRAPAPATQPSS